MNKRKKIVLRALKWKEKKRKFVLNLIFQSNKKEEKEKIGKTKESEKEKLKEGKQIKRKKRKKVNSIKKWSEAKKTNFCSNFFKIQFNFQRKPYKKAKNKCKKTSLKDYREANNELLKVYCEITSSC